MIVDGPNIRSDGTPLDDLRIIEALALADAYDTGDAELIAAASLRYEAFSRAILPPEVFEAIKTGVDPAHQEA